VPSPPKIRSLPTEKRVGRLSSIAALVVDGFEGAAIERPAAIGETKAKMASRMLGTVVTLAFYTGGVELFDVG